MTWVGANKGAGPWEFAKQEDKRGYINNPRWTDSPEHVDKHFPCGYWPLGPAPRDVRSQLYGTGRNASYQLGTGDNTERVVFTGVHSSDFIQVSSGHSHTMALQSDGKLWCVGANTQGELGLGDTTQRTVWTQVPGVWKYVDCFTHHTLAIKDDGTLWGTGDNGFGQLGLNDETDRNIFTQVGALSNWVKVSCGSYYSMALNSSGDLYATGNSYQGALGLGFGSGKRDEFTYVIGDVSSVNCGYYTTIMLEDNGAVWGTGSNIDGQLGLGDKNARTVFTEIVSLGKDNTQICCGCGDQYAYSGITFVVKSNGIMWAAGSNKYNQMGLADTADKVDFVQVPGSDWEFVSNTRYSTLAIKTDRRLWGVGYNYYGELGLGDKNPRTVFTPIGSDLWQFVSNGWWQSLAIGYYVAPVKTLVWTM